MNRLLISLVTAVVLFSIGAMTPLLLAQDEEVPAPGTTPLADGANSWDGYQCPTAAIALVRGLQPDRIA